MLDWTIAISRRGIVASLLWIALGGVAFAQATVPLPPASATLAAPAPRSAAVPPAASPTPLLTDAQLAQLVAPIALYPDPLLAQILMASTYPLEVVEAARWVKIPANQALTGDALTSALQAQSWDPSVKALVPFPRVLENLSDQLQWTEQLGNAFLAQQADLMAAVQSLRREAMAAGNLRQTPQCRCVIQTSGEAISVLPAEPQAVCVPVYSPGVYGTWPYPAYPPFSFPIPAGFVYEPGFWIGFGPPVVLASFGPFWGWGWVDWGHRAIAVDPTRFMLASGGGASFSGNVWVHDPAHRGGVAYADPGARARFDAARVSAVTAAARSGAGRGAAAAVRSGVAGSEAAHGPAGRFGAAAVHAGVGASHRDAALRGEREVHGGTAFHHAPASHSREAFHGASAAFHEGGPRGGGSVHFAMSRPHGGGPTGADPHGGGAPHLAIGAPHGGGPAGAGPHGGGAPHGGGGGHNGRPGGHRD
jgi:hypothetical protein